MELILTGDWKAAPTHDTSPADNQQPTIRRNGVLVTATMDPMQ